MSKQQSKSDVSSKSDIEEIEEIEIVKEIKIVKDKPDQTAVYFGLGIVAIIGSGIYYWYSKKPKEKIEPKEKIKPKEKVELVKSGIINME